MSALLASPWARWGLAAVLQLVLIGLPLADRLQVHWFGREVTLALRPIDPRDLLRGDYVILNPEIGQVQLETGMPQGLASGDEVWVVVEPDDEGISRAVAVLSAPPGDGRIALKGRVTGVPASASGALRVDYGLETFFVPEGQGIEIERMPADRVRLVVAVADDGRSAPLRLMADGEVLLKDSAF
ncbi:GDYXXLXY domain-containing protein [Stappia sp. TSB10GB4]|uniref:GDYXXLXY domain-containing protein n=1 Tax=Stappia sp. TSB10GB4 TaxID=2003584 RepID=UPI0016493DA8|nr:GDYXXLXY domain-containing protein [Stappia sp. TSB10GB4]